MNIRKRIVLIILVMILVVSIFCSCSPKQLKITSWNPREIIAQGYLVSVSMAGDANKTQWLIGLELRPSNTDKYETFIYHLSGDFDVGTTNINGRPIDVLDFKLGQYYLLYRKLEEGKLSYYLSPDYDITITVSSSGWSEIPHTNNSTSFADSANESDVSFNITASKK